MAERILPGEVPGLEKPSERRSQCFPIPRLSKRVLRVPAEPDVGVINDRKRVEPTMVADFVSGEREDRADGSGPETASRLCRIPLE